MYAVFSKNRVYNRGNSDRLSFFTGFVYAMQHSACRGEDFFHKQQPFACNFRNSAVRSVFVVSEQTENMGFFTKIRVFAVRYQYIFFLRPHALVDHAYRVLVLR